MFKFLKKLFDRPQKPEEIEQIDIAKIEGWLSKKTSEIMEIADENVNSRFDAMKEEIKETRDTLVLLEHAELRNPDISLRAKQIMEGNRTAYIARITQFLDSLDMENKGFFSAKAFCSSFDAKANELGTQIYKPYYVLQEFLAHESSRVAKCLKELDTQVKELKGVVEGCPLYSLEDLQKAMKGFKEQQDALKDIDLKVKEARTQLENHRLAREKIEKNISALKKSELYANYKQMVDKRDSLVSDIKLIEDELSQHFSYLDKPLRKHSRVAMNEKLVLKYASSPILALLDDDKLEILNILDCLKQNLAYEKLELKDRQKEKAMAAIEKLNRSYFESFLSRHSGLKSAKKEIDTKVLTNSINQQYNDLLYKHEHYLKKCQTTIEEINDLEKNRIKFNPDKFKSFMEQQFSNIAMKKVVFVEPNQEKDTNQEKGINQEKDNSVSNDSEDNASDDAPEKKEVKEEVKEESSKNSSEVSSKN